MSAPARKQAPRLAKPVTRYWQGKAPKGVAEVASESDSDEDLAPREDEEEGVSFIGGQDLVREDEDDEDDEDMQQGAGKHVKTMNVTLRNVNISKDGKVIVAGREESGRTTMEEEDEEEEEDEDEEDEEEPVVSARVGAVKSGESSEYESDSEEERPQFRPVFVPKRARVTVLEKEALAQDSEEALKKKELEAEERRKQSHDLVAESIRRELLEKEKEEEVPDVDDTDGLDPEAEFEAWRLRELGRIKKEKEEEIRQEEERLEIERRRALPEEQRLKEDLERAQKLREEKPKGQQKFLQKYWHKGAFHQDEEILQRHDFTEATESTVDVSLLPKVMQVKNFGKRSRTKYTHLLDQDTTVTTGGFGGTAPVKGAGKPLDGGGCFLCGGPHLKKDCPQNTGPPMSRGQPGTGSNATPTGPRRTGRDSSSWRDRDRDRDRESTRERQRDRDNDRQDYNQEKANDNRGSPRPRPRESDGYRDRYQPRNDTRNGWDSYDSRARRRSRSRSPSPRRYRDDLPRKERRRSRERSVDHGYGEKRRRID